MHPDKVVGWKEMPFGKVTRVVRSNTVLVRGPGPPPAGEIWGWKLQFADADCCQIILALVSVSKFTV